MVVKGGVGYVSELIIKKEDRGKKYGTMLMNKLIEVANEHKCHKITVRTSERHLGALNLYRLFGFQVEAEFRNDKSHLTWFQLCLFI